MTHQAPHVAAAFAIFALACSPAAQEPPSAPPHIVVYLIDTLRADALGCYGSEPSRTPNLDALAGESAVFANAMSVAPWTVPSVASLMTSTYPSVHSVVHGGVQVPDELTTLSELMNGTGYETALFTFSPFGGSATGLDRGYDYVFERSPGEKTEEQRRAADGIHVPFQEWLASWEPDEPLFVSLHSVEPHYPISRRDVAEDVLDLSELNKLFTEFRNKSFPSPPAQRGKPEGRARLEHQRRRQLAEVDATLDGQREHARGGYLAAVEAADAHLGRVVNTLRAKGVWDDTVFIVVSDHGEEFREHGFWLHDHSLFSELVHVPLMVRIPDRTEGGVRIDDVVSTIDLVPTVADLSGLEPLGYWQGESLVPQIFGASAARPVVAERINLRKRLPGVTELRGERETAVILGPWKLIEHHDVDDVSLFDLRTDPGDTRDLATEHPDVVAELRERLKEWRERQESMKIFQARRKDLDAEQLERLSELGYAEGH